MKNRSRRALLVGALFMLGTGTITAYQSTSKTIAIVDDGKVTQYETWDVYVEDVLASQEIMLGPNDEITPGLEDELEDGSKIVIERWEPTVRVTVDGKEYIYKTSEQTVGDLLEIKDIEVDEYAHISVPLDQKITDGLKVEIKNRTVITKSREEVIPHETEIRETTELAFGEQRVITEGIDGINKITEEIVQLGGVTVEENIIGQTVIKESQTEIIEQGMKNVIVDEATGERYEYTTEYTLEATAYTDIPGDRWYGITASGAPTFVGMVAVDRNVIPLGTILYVEGYGIAIAGDVGGAIKGYDIDLFLDTEQEVYNHGRVDRQVYVLKDQSYDVDGIIEARSAYETNGLIGK